jgi:hypothetical protein
MEKMFEMALTKRSPTFQVSMALGGGGFGEFAVGVDAELGVGVRIIGSDRE